MATTTPDVTEWTVILPTEEFHEPCDWDNCGKDAAWAMYCRNCGSDSWACIHHMERMRDGDNDPNMLTHAGCTECGNEAESFDPILETLFHIVRL
jgi:hypothetical protein